MDVDSDFKNFKYAEDTRRELFLRDYGKDKIDECDIRLGVELIPLGGIKR